MEFNRRAFLRNSALAGAALGMPVLNPSFLVNSAFAAEGKVLNFLSAENLTGNWDPSSHTTLAQINLESFVFGYLTRAPMGPDKPDELVMELATDMKLIDEHTLEFKLREGVTFHDGKPFKAEDVKATFEYASQTDRPAAWYPGPCEVEIVSDYVARVKTDKAGYPASLFWFLSAFLPIMSAKDVADPKTLSARPNGTGSFKFARQDGNTTVLEAFDAFYLGKPKIPGINFSFVGDATTRTLALLNGEADLIERLEAEQVDTIEKTGGFQHPQGCLGREQVSLVPLLEAAFQRCPLAASCRSCNRSLGDRRYHGCLGPRIECLDFSGEVRLRRHAELSEIRSG